MIDPLTIGLTGYEALKLGNGLLDQFNNLFASKQRNDPEANGLVEGLKSLLHELELRRSESIAADYQLLGCSMSDSATIIRKRYRLLTKIFHPDTVAGKDLPRELIAFTELRLREIHAAYDRINKRQDLSIERFPVSDETACPHCNGSIIVDGDGEYICPWCEEEVTVADNAAVESYELECPHCGEMALVNGDGEYTCPECGEDFVVGDA